MANTTTPSHAAATDLRPLVQGRVIAPGDSDYDGARTVYYTGYDRRPAAIVRPADAPDVARAVGYARARDLPLTVRSGGHSVAAHSMIDGGVVIDLASLKEVEVDVEGRTAWAQGGLTAAEYTARVGEHQLVTGFGDAPSVGIGGITLGGGVGFLHRKLGLTIDSLLAAEVVTADGEVVHADAESNPDLFWALRGGGGNFGVVTRFRYRLHAIDDATGGMLMLPASPEVIERFFALQMEAPDELSGMASVMFAPPMPFVPADHHGKPVIFAMLVHAGPAEQGERVLAPFRRLATPILDMMRPFRYAKVYEGGPEPPHPSFMAVRTFFTDRVDRAAGEAILDHLRRSTAPMRVAQFRVLGGAVARVAADATAFAHRQRGAIGITAAAYEDPGATAEHAAWAAGIAADLRQGEPGAYLGFLADLGDEGVREAYPEPTLGRLRRIKGRYDPTNLFRSNHNITPQ